MKFYEVVDRFKLDAQKFNEYLSRTKPEGFVFGFLENKFANDANIDAIVNSYRLHEAKEAEDKARSEKAAVEKQIACSKMLITSGFNFDGYKITKYSGYISGDDAVSVDRGFAIFGENTSVKDKLLESLVIIRRNALAELKEAAYALGCNAVIGVDFDYLTLDPQRAGFPAGVTTYDPYIFGVTANGNAVIIEKITE